MKATDSSESDRSESKNLRLFAKVGGDIRIKFCRMKVNEIRSMRIVDKVHERMNARLANKSNWIPFSIGKSARFRILSLAARRQWNEAEIDAENRMDENGFLFVGDVISPSPMSNALNTSHLLASGSTLGRVFAEVYSIHNLSTFSLVSRRLQDIVAARSAKRLVLTQNGSHFATIEHGRFTLVMWILETGRRRITWLKGDSTPSRCALDPDVVHVTSATCEATAKRHIVIFEMGTWDLRKVEHDKWTVKNQQR